VELVDGHDIAILSNINSVNLLFARFWWNWWIVMTNMPLLIIVIIHRRRRSLRLRRELRRLRRERRRLVGCLLHQSLLHHQTCQW
jgi:hypothetical protein